MLPIHLPKIPIIKIQDLKLSHIFSRLWYLNCRTSYVFFPKNTSFTQSYAREENIEEISEYELNCHRLNIQSIISENSDHGNGVKEQVLEERDIEFITEYTNNPTLPKSEEVVKQEGCYWKRKCNRHGKTYEMATLLKKLLFKQRKTCPEPISKNN